MAISIFATLAFACGRSDTSAPSAQLPPSIPSPTPSSSASPTPDVPELNAELLDPEFTRSASPIGAFDFRNFVYELPRGWQNPDGSTQLTLENGFTEPKGVDSIDPKTPDEKAASKFERRIGLRHMVTKFIDATGDGEDEAVVILQIETGGSATPFLVYVFTWKDDKPHLIWPFRTGDRADGGLKSVRTENGLFIVELYGQDRFLLGQTETGRITGDEASLCCPEYFTRTQYKWTGKNFQLQGKRLTYQLAEPDIAPEENVGDKVNVPKARR